MKIYYRILRLCLGLGLSMSLMFFQSLNASLQEEWDRESFHHKPAPILSGKHIIFVGGLLNELADLLGSYFSDNIEVARKMGATTSYIAPSSSKSVPQNAEILYKIILDNWQKNHKPLILVGHSKGAAEIFFLLLSYPHLVRDKIIEYAVLIQAAIGGSPLAEQVGGCLGNMVISWLNPNLQTVSLTGAHNNSQMAFSNFKQALRYDKALEDIISSRIFYVRSELDNGNISFGLQLVLNSVDGSLDNYGYKHDGLMPLQNQMHRSIGVDLGVLKADHADLVVSTISRISSERRKDFTRLLFRKINERLK